MSDEQPVPFHGTFNIFARYFKAYGGWRALLGSFYFIASMVMTAIMHPLWAKPGWWENSIAILPNLIGFSLGGYAILLSFGSDKFKTLLAKAKIEDVSAFGELSATFAHFIIVQMVALLLALLAKTYAPDTDQGAGAIAPGLLTLWGVGFFALIYAIFCGVAATMRTFRLSENFATHLMIEARREEENRRRLERTNPPANTEPPSQHGQANPP